MGFRSSFTTEHYSIAWPKWFREKYDRFVWFHGGHLASRGEWKTYSTFTDLHEDIQKAIDWEELVVPHLALVWLHECGGVTRVHIGESSIRIDEPEEWVVKDESTHWYCYEHCSR